MPVTTSGQKESLYSLLDYLAKNNHPANEPWQDWQITKIEGGFNNLLYQAIGPVGDFAIKFTIRDQRDRAGREYGALLALQGEFEFNIDGKKQIVKAGDSMFKESNVLHGTICLKKGRLLDVFSPHREDLIK